MSETLIPCTVLESFPKRVGTRNFLPKVIPDDIKQKINTKIQEVLNKEGNEWENTSEGLQIILVEHQISMYKNCSTFMACFGPVDHSRRLLMKAGYLLHQIVLYCVQLGLGTHWVGGKQFTSSVGKAYKKSNPDYDLKKNLVICMAPIGYSAEKQHFMEKVFNFIGKARTRKPYKELFFDEKYKNELKVDDCYKDCFENVRLSPSAMNVQPWKIIKKEKKYHFFTNPTSSFYSNIGIGIGIASWHITCKEKEIKGKLVTEENVNIPDLPKKAMYFMTWIDEA